MTPADGKLPTSPTVLAGGRYRVEDTLGAGGMGIVVRAWDQQLQRAVAIKLLADNLAANADARERFEREARAAARLNHTNVVQIFDVGEQDDRPYIVMELVEGPSLADLAMQGRRPSEDEWVRIGEQALAALQVAHESDLLHRDIKPANLLLTTDGTLKVTDFGVAEVAQAPSLTRTGHVLGTMPYLAPERLRGEPASPATDLYALGATLHEVATGSPPGDGVPLPEDLPSGVRQLIERCLERDPAQRPASATAARRILEGREPTRRLTIDETVAVTAQRGERTRPVGTRDRDEPASPAAAPSERPVERPETGPSSRASSTWSQPRTVLIALGLAVILALLLTTGGGDGGSEETAPTETPTSAQTDPDASVPPIERGEDAASTARNIADWIRERAGG